MKTRKLIYWMSTAIVCLAMVYSSYSDLYSNQVRQAFMHLGFPAYFRVELGIMKVIGIILLLAPLPNFLREWSYAGFTITFISAFIAHTASGDPVGNRIAPLIILFFLMISYFSFRQSIKSNIIKTK